MTTFLHDLRHAARVLVRNPGATGIMVLTLALAIGAVTALFSVVYGVLLRPLPYPASDRIMAVWEVNSRGTWSRLADPNFADFRDRNRTFQSLAKYSTQEASVAGATEPTRTVVGAVSRQFFDVLGVQPVLGRGFSAEDARPGTAPVIVASHGYWARYLGSGQDLSRFALRIENRVYAVVGVMPAGFEFPAGAGLWVPAELEPENTSRTSHNAWAIGRLGDGVTVADAGADLSHIAGDIVRNSPEHNDYLLRDAAVVPLQASITHGVGSPLWILLGAVCFLLLVACANVANILLSQAVARGREIAIRSALGAGRGRLVRQFLTESLLLACLCCAGGCLFAFWGIDALLAMAPADLPRLESVSINGPVLAFAVGMSALVALGLGIVTAVRATGGRGGASLIAEAQRQTGSKRNRRLGQVIVAAQLAITLVLMVGAGLLGRSLLRVLSVDPGFRTDGIVTVDLSLPYAEDAAAKRRLAGFFASVLERLGSIPGVKDVGAVSAVPMDTGLPDGMFLVMSPEELPAKMEDFAALAAQKERQGEADFCVASAGYFRALGIPLVRGRMFDEHDGEDQTHVALISESLARGRWPGVDPLGRTIEFGNMDGDLRLLTIVGIVGDTHEYGLERPPRPTVYVNTAQRPRSTATVVMRATTDPESVIGPARDILRGLAPDVPPRFRTLSQICAAALGARNFNLTLVALFALTALVLGVAGIYGVMAYNVSQRTREIGIRIALGATAGRVLGLIVGQGLRTALAGIACGVAGALALTRTFQTLLFGVKPTDPLTFAAMAVLLASVSTLACWIPSRRAARVDPLVALRHE